MDGMKRFAVLVFAGCLFLFAAIFLSRSVYDKALDLNGQISMNKAGISVRDEIRPEEGYFTLKDMEDFEKALNTDVMAYAAQENSWASYETNTVKVGVTGINELAPMFENIRMIRGSFFSKADCREKSRVIVIDDAMAWKLFGSDHVLGYDIDLFGSRFKVTGVMKSDGSVIGKLADDGSVKAYIPIQTYLDIKKDAGIFYLQYKTDSENASGKNRGDVTAALASMGKDPANYFFTDYNVKKAVMAQKPALLLFFMGLSVLAAVFFYLIKYMKKNILGMINECKTDYFTHVTVVYRYKILKALLFLIFAGSVSVIVWRWIRFNLYVAPDLIPDDFTDVQYYTDLFWGKASQAFSTAGGYTVPFRAMASNAAEAAFNWIFYTGCFAGILFFYTGLSWVKKTKIPAEKALLACGGFLAADLGIFALLALLTGLPCVVDPKGIILFWSFVFTNLVLFLPESEGMIPKIENKERFAQTPN